MDLCCNSARDKRIMLVVVEVEIYSDNIKGILNWNGSVLDSLWFWWLAFVAFVVFVVAFVVDFVTYRLCCIVGWNNVPGVKPIPMLNNSYVVVDDLHRPTAGAI